MKNKTAGRKATFLTRQAPYWHRFRNSCRQNRAWLNWLGICIGSFTYYAHDVLWQNANSAMHQVSQAKMIFATQQSFQALDDYIAHPQERKLRITSAKAPILHGGDHKTEHQMYTALALVNEQEWYTLKSLSDNIPGFSLKARKLVHSATVNILDEQQQRLELSIESLQRLIALRKNATAVPPAASKRYAAEREKKESNLLIKLLNTSFALAAAEGEAFEQEQRIANAAAARAQYFAYISYTLWVFAAFLTLAANLPPPKIRDRGGEP